MGKMKTLEIMDRVEEAQRALRDSIEHTRRLAQDAERLVRRAREEANPPALAR